MTKLALVLAVLAALLVAGLALRGRASSKGREGGWMRERLAICGQRPNCVSSRETRARFRAEPMRFTGSPQEAFERAREIVQALPRTRVVTSEAGYLHAECSSAVFRFVDDLELELDTEAGVIHVRSASRVGTSDLGVNRKRVERIRAALA